MRRTPRKYKATLVKQEHDSTCVIASVAMMSGLSYKETYEKYLTFSQITPEHLNSVGVCMSQEYEFYKYLGVKVIRQQFPCIWWHRLYACTVPSINNPRGLHRIVIDSRDIDEGVQVLDPSTLKQYKDISDIKGYAECWYLVKR